MAPGSWRLVRELGLFDHISNRIGGSHDHDVGLPGRWSAPDPSSKARPDMGGEE